MKKAASITWNQVYEKWKQDCYGGPSVLRKPIDTHEIHIEYDRPGEIFYGYDWITNVEYKHRTQLIASNPAQFLYATQPTNKGTIHTLQMLVEAKDEEERAAIWICAFAKEVMDHYNGKTLRIANQLWELAYAFLSKRYYMWHHAMKRLVPAIFVHVLLSDLKVETVEAMIHLANLNAALILHEYTPTLYSSLDFGSVKTDESIRR